MTESVNLLHFRGEDGEDEDFYALAPDHMQMEDAKKLANAVIREQTQLASNHGACGGSEEYTRDGETLRDGILNRLKSLGYHIANESKLEIGAATWDCRPFPTDESISLLAAADAKIRIEQIVATSIATAVTTKVAP